MFADTTTVQSKALQPLGKQRRFAYISLLTRSTYLAGVVLLAHTLRKQGSQYPLIVLYTPSLTQSAIDALELEAKYSDIELKPCELLIPPEHHELNVAVERFTDTWTKLRVFEQFQDGYDALCYLDADMTIHKNMDAIFDNVEELPQGWIAAVHDCVCSPDKMPWTPEDHNQENCPLTPQYHSKALTQPMIVKTTGRPTYQLFNSGMFLFRPRKQLWQDILQFFNTTDLLGTFKFPDQDFMTHFFRGRWMSVGWQYNAVKTMAYRHENLWRTDEIVCLHYIVDKPWAKRIGTDGVAGFKGLDGDTHRMWWREYESWFADRQGDGQMEVITVMSKHVARRESEVSDDARPDMATIGQEVHSVIDVVSGKEFMLEGERQVDAALDAVAVSPVIFW